MSYLDRAPDPRCRNIAIVGVAAIHALLAYGILTGLAVHFIPPLRHGPTGGVEVPLPPPPPSTPTPAPKQMFRAHNTDAPQLPFPLPIPSATSVPLQPSATPGAVIPTYAPPSPMPSTFGVKPKDALPRNDPDTWVRTDDYPIRDEAEGHEGTVVFRVVTAADGTVGACEVVRSSGYPGLDLATCKAVQRRARFKPATDVNGDATAGTYTSTVRWRIPR
jgi:protein TonB